MKHTILLFISAFLLSSCATKTTAPDSFSHSEQELRSNLAFVNYKIWGDYPKDNYSDFNEKFYYEKLLSYSAKPAAQLRESLKDFDLPLFVATSEAYAICAFSPKLGIAFCDDAHCTGVEHFERTKSAAVIEKWKEELPLSSCNKESVGVPNESATFGLTTAKPSNIQTLDHKYFVIHYDKSYRLANYVEYTLTADQMKKSIADIREDRFRTDPLLPKEYAVTKNEYLRSGYDKGHLANSKDFSFSKQANDATFVMSNMTPQSPNLNQKSWRLLENQVHKWACGEEKLKILTGPILKANLKTLRSGLPVPEKFFKIVLDETPPKKMIAFIYQQSDSEDVMEKRTVTMTTLKKEVIPQLTEVAKPDFRDFPISNLDEWKSFDCFTKKKPKKIAKQ